MNTTDGAMTAAKAQTESSITRIYLLSHNNMVIMKKAPAKKPLYISLFVVVTGIAVMCFFLLRSPEETKTSSTTSTNVPDIPHPNQTFTMPAEEHAHEGTWLQWPHNYEDPSRKLVLGSK